MSEQTRDFNESQLK
jgi:hypothetical protein